MVVVKMLYWLSMSIWYFLDLGIANGQQHVLRIWYDIKTIPSFLGYISYSLFHILLWCVLWRNNLLITPCRGLFWPRLFAVPRCLYKIFFLQKGRSRVILLNPIQWIHEQWGTGNYFKGGGLIFMKGKLGAHQLMHAYETVKSGKGWRRVSKNVLHKRGKVRRIWTLHGLHPLATALPSK